MKLHNPVEEMTALARAYKTAADALKVHPQFGSIAEMTPAEAPEDLIEKINKYHSAREALAEKGVTAIEDIAPKFKPKIISGTSYQNLTIESLTPRDGNNKKQLLTYDQSLARLKTAGFQRHLRPAEAFGLLADGLEGKLSKELQAVSQDMLSSYGEWLSLAVERKKDALVCYLDPQGLEWNGSVYVKKSDFASAEKQEFSIVGIPSQSWTDIARFYDTVVRFLYGRSFKELPQEMQTGNRRAQAYLPPDGTVWPVGRGIFINNFDVNGCYYVYRASRGGSPRR